MTQPSKHRSQASKIIRVLRLQLDSPEFCSGSPFFAFMAERTRWLPQIAVLFLFYFRIREKDTNCVLNTKKSEALFRTVGF
jgi:hypothetical protein